MTDRELLELAAKAAGYGDVWSLDEHPDVTYIGPRYDGGTVRYRVWTPLTDDGDALRLMVRLGFDFVHDQHNRRVCIESEEIAYDEAKFGGDCDPLAATRRAIVRAAAEIGRAKP